MKWLLFLLITLMVEPVSGDSSYDIVKVPMDRSVHVFSATAYSKIPVIYLHGKCGDPDKVTAFQTELPADMAVISLLGDIPCKGGYRSEWTQDVSSIHRRIQHALDAVSKHYGIGWSSNSVKLVGYSAGATRAESLARAYPNVYRELVLIGGPTIPTADALQKAKKVVVMAGSLDRWRPLEAATHELTSKGVSVQFRLLPDAKHGEYGPYGGAIMKEVLQSFRGE